MHKLRNQIEILNEDMILIIKVVVLFSLQYVGEHAVSHLPFCSCALKLLHRTKSKRYIILKVVFLSRIVYILAFKIFFRKTLFVKILCILMKLIYSSHSFLFCCSVANVWLLKIILLFCQEHFLSGPYCKFDPTRNGVCVLVEVSFCVSTNW